MSAELSLFVLVLGMCCVAFAAGYILGYANGKLAGLCRAQAIILAVRKRPFDQERDA